MALPKRPIQHQLEEESRRAFENILPPRITYRKHDPDYGLDGDVEEFDQQTDEATGRRFHIQLKSTGSKNESKSARIKHETGNYYRLRHLPVLMVFYHAQTQRLFARWFHEFDPYYENYGETHLTFHWSDDDEITRDDIPRLFDEAERIVRLKTSRLHLPLQIEIRTPSPAIYGHARSEIQLAIDAALSRCTGLITKLGSGENPDVVVEVTEDEISANLSGIASVTFHSEDGVYIASQTPDQIASDTLSCVAVSLAKAGHGDAAARLASRFFPQSSLSAMPPLAAILIPGMLQAGRIMEVLEIADRLDSDEEEPRQLVGTAIVAALWPEIDTFEPHELQKLEETLQARLKRRLEAEQPIEASATAQNLADLAMTRHRPGEAIDFFNQMIELDPGRESGDSAARLAGANFLDGRYEDAVTAYERALGLSEETDPHLKARYADALMFAGRYADAFDTFDSIQPHTRDLQAWVYTKMTTLAWVIQETGIESQQRNPSAANQLADTIHENQTAEEQDQIAGQIWQHDAISALGWFAQARNLLDQGLEEEAMLAYLTAATVHEGLVEAWVNVAILAMTLNDENMLTASVITAQRLNPDTYAAQFARELSTQIEDPEDREQLLSAIRKAIDETTNATNE